AQPLGIPERSDRQSIVAAADYPAATCRAPHRHDEMRRQSRRSRAERPVSRQTASAFSLSLPGRVGCRPPITSPVSAWGVTIVANHEGEDILAAVAAGADLPKRVRGPRY